MVETVDDSEPTRRPFYRARSITALAEAVQAMRTDAGKTQTELALDITSSRPTISRMERGMPVATDTLLDALTACGYELVLIPRGARLTVSPQ
ncbi:helix-turn-helix domain-containing protein [Cellulomonas soli]|uniref:HTH cro/C1-type domain-containing protein n=1 Tax=Cellulomonas soli TaxID=931535 RepID=A0A512PCK3_9CELL|nr:helix-turn-helix transcriptional regulator [Cellulomonas soli]NYI58513.1 transcriptional regulator with XRE-family HTH domain [Cellulomonas soli]GEP68937.1 hypothetical protein CSO01_16520 [Cellulomonas soli]